MGFRSANERTTPSKESSSIPSIQELTGGSNRNRSHGGRGSSLTPQECESRFGVEIYMDGLDTKIQRLAKKHGAGQVREWADEGMTVDTMGKPRDMRAFRQRQKERPAEVPKDIERRNAKSVQRSRGAHHEASKAGDTQVPDSVRDVISSPGQSLNASIQRVMEDRMGDNLGDVRIHTGPSAAKACEDINARAFTVGNHVAFNHGEYDPSSAEGQHILAHELAHVRQQTGGAVSMLPQEGELEIDPDPQLEREAEETAQRVMKGWEAGVHRMEHSEVHVQRHHEDQKRRPNGEFGPLKEEIAKKRTKREEKPYGHDQRPRYEPGQREEVWNRAKGPNGVVFCAVDEVPLDRDEWCMGHKPRREYWYLVEYYLRGIITREEFLAEYRNPDHYQPESHRASSSGEHEQEGEYWAEKWGPLE
ncbi:eCIS core domain-containing protein [Halogeometricum borinquense]|uniref:eCIS core domain-containing protein n=1 Tax=Halogeometricum borinquense TaxID=60847 RepID=UPI003446FD6A